MASSEVGDGYNIYCTPSLLAVVIYPKTRTKSLSLFMKGTDFLTFY
jgi:hypothetical protein